MADPMQQARELVDRLDAAAASWPTVYSSDRENIAMLRAAATMLESMRAANACKAIDIRERNEAISRWKQNADKHRDGHRAALDRVAELEAALRAAPEGLIEQHARDSQELRRLCQSRDFYKLRCEALQAVQSNMRDPERKAVCDILANGSTNALAARPQGVK